MKGKRQFLSFSDKPSCRRPITAPSNFNSHKKIKGVKIMGKITKPIVREIIEDFAQDIRERKNQRSSANPKQ